MMDSKGDVGLKEDLTQSLMELVSMEHHAKMSFYMSQNPKWLEFHEIVREIRQKWLQAIVKKDNIGQEWCLSKHLLGAIKSMQEVGTRLYSMNQKELSLEAESDASILLGLYYNLNEIKEDKKHVGTNKKVIADA